MLPPYLPRERIKTKAAGTITGKSPRVLQLMAAAGEIPGAIKIRGEWTFSEAKLRAWLAELEAAQLADLKAASRTSPRRPPSGDRARTVHAPGSAGDRYERAMQRLLKPPPSRRRPPR